VNALLLDLDDTLLDYSGGVDESWREACVTCCVPVGLDVERLMKTLVETRQQFWSDPSRHRQERVNMVRAWQRIAAGALTSLGIACDGLDATMAREYAARRRAAMQLFPDALETLEELRARGVPLGLVTNGDAGQQRDKIERFELAPFFEVMVIEGEFGAGKPDEAVYRHALDHLGVAPGETSMVGDHLEFDVAGPQRLGLRGIWLDREGVGLADSPVRPHRVIRSLRELIVSRQPLTF
jgi:putative hydrolase of the HAD superfamily